MRKSEIVVLHFGEQVEQSARKVCALWDSSTPHGVPEIVVTFDIDADVILNVSEPRNSNYTRGAEESRTGWRIGEGARLGLIRRDVFRRRRSGWLADGALQVEIVCLPGPGSHLRVIEP